ncbi:MAG TPA: NAD(P)-dependent alcohol dehydrogenase [Gemmataceae bacterium]|nr:NAD(P)-dependent alcohol dehydrogenase [Gemmataceae bacterium]
MKAIRIHRFGDAEELRIEEAPEPRPGPGQVRVRIRAASLNYRDLLILKGLYSRNLSLPLIPLSDGAGEVVEAGPGATRFAVGARVAGIFMQTWLGGMLSESNSKSALGGAIDGLLAEQVVLNEDGLVAVPEHLSFEEAATLPCAAVTAWNALMELSGGGVRPGETVLTLGTGGVSLFALQFAHMAGARVIATSSSDAKLERAKQLGASDGVNYKTTPEWDKKVRDLTGGVGVDHVVEVGGAGTLPRSLKAVRAAGHVALIGVLSGAGDVNPMPVLMKAVRLQGVFVGSRAMFEAMNRAIALHRMKPVIDRVFGFEEVRAAYRHLESGAHFGKIVLRL